MAPDHFDYVVAVATLVSTVISVLVSLITIYFQHKVGESNRKIRIANALLAEIEATFSLQYNDLIGDKVNLIQKATKGTERFTTWGNDNHIFYNNSISELLLLNDETIRSVIKFYDYASFISATVQNMSSDSFHNLP